MRTYLWNLLWKIDGVVAIPHELMHMVAHRMIGKRCAYRLGARAVTPREACTRVKCRTSGWQQMNV
jgi:hypothetical protein